MKIKLILILMLVSITLLFPIVSAEEFSIEIQPHYYVQGTEIIWTPDVTISSISFEIIGINHNTKYRILNLSIIDGYPLAFKNALPDTIESLRISQEKTLWTSRIIDLDDVNDSNIDFWVGVEGMLENTNEVIYQEEHLNVTLIMPENEDNSFLKSLGERIWEGSPTNGIIVLVIVIIIGGFMWWNYKGSDKLDQWRDKSEKRRVEKRRYEERW
jgi:hypothetical protein